MSPNPQAIENQYYDTLQTAAYFKLDEETLMAYVHQLSLSPKLDEQTGLLMLAYRDIELLRRAIPPQTPKKAQDALASATGVRRFGSAPAPKREGFVPRQPETSPQTIVQEPSLPPAQSFAEEDYLPDPPAALYDETEFNTQALYEAQYPIGSPEKRPASGAIPNYSTQNYSSESASEDQIGAKQALAPVAAKPSPLPRPASAINPANAGLVEKKDNLAMIVEAVSHAKEGILKDLSRLLDDKLAGLDEVVVELIRCKSENDTLKEKLKAALDEKESLRHELTKFKPVQFGFYRKVN